MSIVVGYIPTAEGKSALERAVDETKLRHTNLVVLNSSRGDAYADPKYAQEDELRRIGEHLDESGVQYELRQFVRGKDAAEEVVDLAAELDAELVVIGIRHRTAVGKLLLGSTAQRILLDAECPVLAVKAPHKH